MGGCEPQYEPMSMVPTNPHNPINDIDEPESGRPASKAVTGALGGADSDAFKYRPGPLPRAPWCFK